MNQGASRRLRIVWVFDWFAYYSAGVVRALAEVADVMVVTRDHGFELGSPDQPMETMRQLFPTCEQIVFVAGRQSDPRSIASAVHVRDKIRDFRPDVIHVQDHFDWRLWLATAGVNVGRVLTIHDVQPHLGWRDPRGGVQRRVERAVRASADAVCVHGDSLAADVPQQSWYRAQSIHRIPLGAQAHASEVEELPLQPTALFFGRLERYKGLDVFVDAVELAAERIPNLKAIVAGQGEAAEPSHARARSAPIDWRLGFVPDHALPGLFGESSIVVLPYLEASQSGVIPVAFSNGRAVIASRVGALPEVVTDGVNGMLVEPGSARAVAEALVTVLGDREYLSRLSQGAVDTIVGGAISADAVAAAHLDVYGTVIRKREDG